MNKADCAAIVCDAVRCGGAHYCVSRVDGVMFIHGIACDDIGIIKCYI